MARPYFFARYLKPFAPKRIAHRFTDALVLGSGLAGMRAALALDDGLSVTVVTKEGAAQSNSSWAQGGIAAVWDPADKYDAHFNDTLVAGQGLCDTRAVDLVVREAPGLIRELIEWGTDFDKVGGAIDLGLEGGHSFHRILHALGDATGKEIMRAVLAKTAGLPNVTVMENHFIIDLLNHDGRCRGALLYSQSAGLTAIWARETLLATGGCGQVYRETTNPPVATGDGLAMAYRAGATLQDMEFIQFHPTVLYVAGSARHLISEAVRGEGAYLVDSTGTRFMPECDPRAELAPRDIVARSIARQMAKTHHPCVYLDQKHLPAGEVERRFPGLTKLCARFGLDFARDPIPVRPGAHYMVGGVSTDLAGATTLAGLWAAGEVAATGLHGANRLASNSLLEALVFGKRCGAGMAAALERTPQSFQAYPLAHEANDDPDQDIDLRDLRNSLSALMVRDVGIERSSASLAHAVETLGFWSRYILRCGFPDREGWELQNMLLVANLMARSAQTRAESRGTHYRDDHPARDDDRWLVHIRQQRDQPQAWFTPVERDLPKAVGGKDDAASSNGRG